MRSDLGNGHVADFLEAVARILEAQDASPFRVRAWRDGAATIRADPRPVTDVFRAQGREGLEAIPHIGERLASVVSEILKTGRSRLLDRLRGETDLFAALPGIGPQLAERIHHGLGIDTLEELELAAHDGRLARVPGFGRKRLGAVRIGVAARLSRSRLESTRGDAPPVSLLLEMDRRYRAQAAAGRLRHIAPRRMNPTGEAWLPVLHEECAGWEFTVLFSNTPLAHKLGRTGDWVVLFYQHGGHEGRATVVTETRGAQRGLRVVRGREREGAADAELAPALSP